MVNNEDKHNGKRNDNKHYVWFDWAVKHMLRDKANFEILEGFIKVITGKDMTILEILESEGNQSSSLAKFNRVDIKARNEDGEIVIIEVQNIRELDFIERILFGVANAVTEQISLGSPYSAIHKVYSISIVYFDLGSGDDYVYRGQTELRGIHTGTKLLINDKEKRAIEGKSADEVFPEYFIVRVEKFNPNNLSPNYLEQWMDYLKTGMIRSEYDAPGLSRARETLIYDNMTPAEKKEYREHLDDVRARQNALDDSRAEGWAEGLEQGRAEGLEQGLEQGRAEGLREAARNLLKSGVDIKIISQSTGLPEDEIRRL